MVKVSTPASLGSGFFINKQGYLITNYHVMDKAYTLKAKMNNGAHFNVTGAIAVDVEHDLALLKVEAERVDYLKLREKPLPQVGTSVMVFGSPRGAEDTSTPGSVSIMIRGSWLAAAIQTIRTSNITVFGRRMEKSTRPLNSR